MKLARVILWYPRSVADPVTPVVWAWDNYALWLQSYCQGVVKHAFFIQTRKSEMLSPLAWFWFWRSTAQKSRLTAKLSVNLPSCVVRGTPKCWLFMKTHALICFRDVNGVLWRSRLSKWIMKTEKGFAFGLKAFLLFPQMFSTASSDWSYSLCLIPFCWVSLLFKCCIVSFMAASQMSVILRSKAAGRTQTVFVQSCEKRLCWNMCSVYSVRGTVSPCLRKCPKGYRYVQIRG